MVKQSSTCSVINDAYIEDSEYSIQVNRWFLKPLGAWPQLGVNPTLEKTIARLLNITCYLLIAFTIVPSVLFIFLEDTTTVARLKALGPTSHWIMGALNYCFLLLRSDDILGCVGHIVTDWRTVRREKDRQLMLRNAKYGRFIAWVSAVCMHFGVSSYNLIKGIQTIFLSVGNGNGTSAIQLTCPFYTKLMDITVSPVYEIVLVSQFLSGIIVTSVTVGACGLAAVLAMHACGQLGVVMSWLDDFGEVQEKGQENASDSLAYIVQHHLRVLSFVSCIEKIMHQICLVELVGCTFNLCMLGYYCVTEWNQGTGSVPAMIIILTAMTFNIFIFCYIGESLTAQCKEVAERAYMMDWCRLPNKTALGLILIISRSRMVIKITAGKLIQMSITTFGDVIKTSFAYLNMLRQMTT